MENYFQTNLKKLSEMYTQRYLAEKTGFSQASINNYLTKTNEPSMQFLIALKRAFGISIDDFLFKELHLGDSLDLNRYVGNFIVYYYNNNSYKGEVHNNLQNTLNYGVISIVKEKQFSFSVLGSFVKSKEEAVGILKDLEGKNKLADVQETHLQHKNMYTGNFHISNQNLFIYLTNEQVEDECFIILNNPPSAAGYIGGLGTINTVARGREHNPCVQFIILSKNVIDRPDGEIYNALKLDYASISFGNQLKELISLFKRLYIDENELSANLTESQKEAVIENNIKLLFNEIVEANMFRFAKVSNREDDLLYRILKEGVDV